MPYESIDRYLYINVYTYNRICLCVLIVTPQIEKRAGQWLTEPFEFATTFVGFSFSVFGVGAI